jgi:hypothetical protein
MMAPVMSSIVGIKLVSFPVPTDIPVRPLFRRPLHRWETLVVAVLVAAFLA